VSTWWLLLGGWLALQIPFVVGMRRWKKLASRYPLTVTSRLLLPWGNAWESKVKADDVPELRKYRRFLLGYYYGVFLLPVLALFAAMAMT
jgi:hypothetical protein